MAAMTVAELAALEDHNQRRYYESGGWRIFTRTYSVPVAIDVTMPRPGDYFPGEISGPRVSSRGGTSVRPVSKKDEEELRFTVRATEPIMDASTDTQDFQYGN